ncbi:MAG: signal recognition particle-docking protein FtsY, partial [Marinobacter sp.]|nr:signal recognition particle-docking protein FtsY [Marinobacter sp.]
MMAQWISIGVLALLILAFVLDVASRRRRLPRPEPVPQRQPTPAKETVAPSTQTRDAVGEAAAESAPAEVAVTPPPAEPEAPAPTVSVFQRIKSGLGKTRANLSSGLADLFSVGKTVDAALLEDIETTLLMADVGVTATSEIIEALTDKLERKQLKDGEALRVALKDQLRDLLADTSRPLDVTSDKKPYVILMVGVNGVGKTTTIGKLAKHFQQDGKSVMLAAGDTFRAAAVEQLQVWGERNQVPVVAQHTGADSASVIFDAVQSAASRNIDVVIADTAGRLQNKDNLMSELQKVVRVMKKLDEQAPHEVMLVLDAGTGQNALSQ